jgi:membrane protein DedA with SNARE-associated domain
MTYLVLMTITGSVIGCTLLYWAGRRGGDFVNRPPRRERLKQFEDTYRKWGLWAVLVPSILPPPTPFKVFVLSAGVFKVPYGRFFVAVLVGRSIRYFLWGILAVLYGEWAKQVLEGSLHTVGAVLFGALLLMTAGFFIWKMMKRKSQQGVI